MELAILRIKNSSPKEKNFRRFDADGVLKLEELRASDGEQLRRRRHASPELP